MSDIKKFVKEKDINNREWKIKELKNKLDTAKNLADNFIKKILR